ncbi:MAG: class C sortase [Oscillospiraceae bacterium]
MRKRQAVLLLLCIVLLLSGLGLLLYPSVNAWLEKRKIGQDVEVFRNTVTALQQSGGKAVSATATMEESAPPYAELLEAMEAYNESIFADKQDGLCDPWSYQAPVFDLAEYGIEDGIVGILSIPKMDLELPIYLGATAEHLAGGAAQLSQTSMPIGGNNTNCVLAGHRGWYGALFFRHIELLEIGDEIMITNLWETLTYTVSEIRVIEPSDIASVLIQPGRDLMTLLTCHPYGSGGRYRYLVFCERTN